MRQVDFVLREILTKALDGNTFCISRSVTDQAVLDEAVVVDQTGTVTSKTLKSHLVSPKDARCVAIVDRSANVDEAARAITAARFGFGGSSPYAPDLVLVNEFVKKDFFEACSKYAVVSFAREENSVKALSLSGNQNEDIRTAIGDAEGKRQATSFGSNDFKLIDITVKYVLSIRRVKGNILVLQNELY